MKDIIRTLITITLAVAAGIVIDRSMLQETVTDQTSDASAKKPLYWVAPMDAGYRRDKPGKSPMGMDLVPVYATDAGDMGTVVISPRVENNLGVRTAPVKREPLVQRIKTVGFVEFDEDRIHHIHSRIEGWIGSLAVTSTGDPVQKGQLLFELYSPELVNAQEELLAAQRNGNASLQNAAREKLLAFGVSAQQIKALSKRKTALQYVPFHADRTGYVSELNVRHGMFVSPQKKILSIGRLDSVWLIAEVFERQAGWVKPDQRVVLTVQSSGRRSWQGTVDYIYPVLDKKSRSMRLRIKIPNPDEVLKPNMFASVSIFDDTDVEVLTIPREALIRTAAMDRVVKASGGGRFKSVPVRLGRESAGRVEILTGLAVGDLVVTSAQFLIDSESNVDVDLARIETPAAKNQPEPTNRNSMQQSRQPQTQEKNGERRP
ncbi:MAG: efflux RND transporter periplasmic adaptor subunit [Pseudomonadales bacterium]